jgi:predicted permease
VAAVVCGLFVLFGLLGWERLRAWSERHPLLDSLVIVPLLFLGVAYFTRLPVVFCVLIALVAGVPLAVLSLALRRAMQRDGS